MIYNQKANQSRLRTVMGVFLLSVFALSATMINHQIERSILKPLEVRAEIHGKLLAQTPLTAIEVAEVENQLAQTIEPLSVQDQAEVALLNNGKVVWHNFRGDSYLQQIRRHLTNISEAKLTFKTVGNAYVITVPFNQAGQDFKLVKVYDKSLFRSELNQFYLWLIGLAIFLAVIVYLIRRIIVNGLTDSLKQISVAVNRLTDNQYLFEYVPANIGAMDELGLAVVHKKEELKARYSNLDASEQRLALLMGHLNLGVVLISNSGKIELINAQAMQLLNIDKETTQRSYQAVIKSYVLVEMINVALKTHEPMSNDIEMYVPSSKYIDVNIIPFSQATAKAESILVLLYDISQIRRLEKVRTEFVANASHELRTPVTAIKGFAETLLDGALDNPILAEKFITIIANESNRLEVIINDILELSRVEKQSEPMTIRRFELVQVVSNMIEFFYSRASQKDISITVQASGPIEMMTDQHRVEQILTNLLDNAINYSDKQSEITIHLSKVDDYAHFSVADTGIGIPAADQERIFERFYRVDKGRSRNSGGTGLGLSIVRNLVRNMNGTIYVDSELGQGSTFHVELPLEQK